MQPGSIVRFRDRDWVLLPSNNMDIYRMRPLTGATDDVIEVHKKLATIMQADLQEEAIRPSLFPPPSSDNVSDATSAYLLWQAARLMLREGATPLRSLGRISIRPRIYQLVPLLMALRLDPVRLFIADDVGVGKTIEALLVARELIDRGEIERMAVLCPPYLCDHWKRELREKFNLEAVVIRSSTISSLERYKPPDKSIYEHYPIHVISIDWVKSERNRHQFLQFCPELVIVDEVHGAAEASERNRSQQQRHQLLQDIARDEKRHLIMLTATPHSGVRTAFSSLLGLLDPKFHDWDISSLDESQRIELARYFVQRTRKDIEHDWEEERCFPERVSVDETYSLTQSYQNLFANTFEFCNEIISTGEALEEHKRRMRNWAALTLLRCVMSSPAAAVAALEARAHRIDKTNDNAPDFSTQLFEATDELANDEIPITTIEETEEDLPDRDVRRLRQLATEARNIQTNKEDVKLKRCAEIVKRMLSEGFNPIVWCRFVPTAEYVAEGLKGALGDSVQVIAITGRIGDEERRMKIDAIGTDRPRVLVSTDCLSEGINLQEKFTAVLHYDLPWNPNRLEQREGRVDRYGQKARQVKAVRFYGHDNPVDGAVIRVLLDKAREIYRALGTHVPVPEESESVMQAVLNSLFLRRRDKRYLQMTFSDEGDLTTAEKEQIRIFHERWDSDANRERINRTRFAQRAIKPDEVKRELEATDTVLGDSGAVKDFVLSAAQRLGIMVRTDRKDPKVFYIDASQQATSTLPDAVRLELGRRSGEWRISFVSPTPEGAEYVGRNHRLVATLARYLLEEALSNREGAAASRCGVIRTRAVNVLTTLLLLRVRYLVEIPQRAPLLSEEVLVVGYRPADMGKWQWLDDGEALRLLSEARPDANIPDSEKRELAEAAIKGLGEWKIIGNEWDKGGRVQEEISKRINARALELERSHKQIRKAMSMRIRELRVKPQLPPDLLGILVLQPVVRP